MKINSTFVSLIINFEFVLINPLNNNFISKEKNLDYKVHIKPD
jgi:hypothetical protein